MIKEKDAAITNLEQQVKRYQQQMQELEKTEESKLNIKEDDGVFSTVNDLESKIAQFIEKTKSDKQLEDQSEGV